MRTVFLDTVGLLAIWDKADQWHDAAERAMKELLLARCRLVTSSFVMLECGNAASRSTYREDVSSLREELADFGNLIIPSEDDERMAWDAYVKGKGARAGIVDQVSFVVMRRLALTEVFTNDRHFEAAGFTTLF